MKATLQIILGVCIVALGYWVYTIFATPIEFQEQTKERETAVIERMKDIRTVQRSFRSKYGKFAGSFEDLIKYYNNDSLVIELAIGSEDDSAAMGKLVRIKTSIAVKDTLFNHRGAGFNINEIQFIPFSEKSTGAKKSFRLDTASLVTESKVTVPVFQAFAPYTSYLSDLDEQELINYYDLKVKTLGRAPGLQVGSTTEANNEAGNWEN